jgi:hypothetical protein
VDAAGEAVGDELMRTILTVGALLLLLALAVIGAGMRMNECLRVHPLWYCMSKK